MKRFNILFFIIFVLIKCNAFNQNVGLLKLYTIGDNVNIRSSPSITASVNMKVPIFTEFEIEEIGKKETINGNVDYWYKVKNFKIDGWVYGNFTSLKQAGRKTFLLKYEESIWVGEKGMSYKYIFSDTNGIKYNIYQELPYENFDIKGDVGRNFKMTINKIPFKFLDEENNIINSNEWICVEMIDPNLSKEIKKIDAIVETSKNNQKFFKSEVYCLDLDKKYKKMINNEEIWLDTENNTKVIVKGEVVYNTVEYKELSGKFIYSIYIYSDPNGIIRKIKFDFGEWASDNIWRAEYYFDSNGNTVFIEIVADSDSYDVVYIKEKKIIKAGTFGEQNIYKNNPELYKEKYFYNVEELIKENGLK